MSHFELEEGDRQNLDFKKIAKIAETGSDVIPVAVQNAETKDVILIAYINDKALKHTLETGIATFWSTSRNELWIKGGSSGHTFEMVDIFVNCEQNSLVFVVRPKAGGICHTNNASGSPRNCYYRRLNSDSGLLENIDP